MTSPISIPHTDVPPAAGRYRLVPHKAPLKTLWRLSDRGFLFVVAAALLKIFRISPGSVTLTYPARLDPVPADELEQQAKFSLDALRYELRERGFTPGQVVRQRTEEGDALPELIALSSNRMTILFATFQGPPAITLLSLHGRAEGILTTNVRAMEGFATDQLAVECVPGASLAKLVGEHDMHAKGNYRTFDMNTAAQAGGTIRDVAMERMIDHGMLTLVS
jgi:hypothetical protein